MTKEPYEILLRWKDGKFSGGHIQHLIDGVPSGALALGTTDHPWPDALALINADALAGHADATARCKIAEDAALEVPALKKQVAEHQEALAALGEQLRVAKLPPVEQRAKALDDAMKAKEAELAALKAEQAALLQPELI